jgi:hypothetical protein
VEIVNDAVPGNQIKPFSGGLFFRHQWNGFYSVHSYDPVSIIVLKLDACNEFTGQCASAGFPSTSVQ